MNPTHNPPTATGVDTPAQVLRDAALYLERHGWTQGTLYADYPAAVTSPACAVGAIRCVVFGGPIVTATYGQMTQLDPIVWVLADHVHDVPVEPGAWGPAGSDSPNAIVTDWNDDTDRTASDVIATLRAAADDWDRINGSAR